MTDDLLADPPTGPILLCAGADPATATDLAEAAVPLLAERPAVVLATWQPPPSTGYKAVADTLLHDSHPELCAAARRAAADAAGAACAVLEARGRDATRRVQSDDPSAWRVILDVADEIDAAVIVARTSEYPDARAGTLGRVARALAHRSRRPLLLLAPDADPAGADAPALFAYDGSAAADHAVRVAVHLLRPRPALAACAWKSAAHVVGVAMLAIPDEVAHKGAASLDEAARDEADSLARAAATQLERAGWSCETAALRTARSVPGAIIVAGEDHDAAIIVTGSRGRSRMAAALLGSTTEAIVRHAGRPVLLVPPRPQES